MTGGIEQTKGIWLVTDPKRNIDRSARDHDMEISVRRIGRQVGEASMGWSGGYKNDRSGTAGVFGSEREAARFDATRVMRKRLAQGRADWVGLSRAYMTVTA